MTPADASRLAFLPAPDQDRSTLRAEVLLGELEGFVDAQAGSSEDDDQRA